MSLYWASVTLHVFAAVFWLGGLFFLAAVGAPVLRKVDPPELRQALFRKLGEQARIVGWIALAVLFATGVLNLHLRGILSAEYLADPAFWATPYGTALAWKLVTVTVMLVLQAVHDFVIGPRAGRRPAGSAEALRLRRQAALLARFSALVGVAILVVAVRLARGG